MMAGAFCGLSSLFTQTRGLAVVVALVVFFGWETRQRNIPKRAFAYRLVILLAAYAAVVGAGLSYFLSSAGPHALLDALVLFPVRYYGSYNAANRFWEPISHWPQAMAHLPGFFAVLFVHALPLVYLVFPFDMNAQKTCSIEVKEKLVLIACVGSALFVEVINSASLIRLVIASSLAIIIALWMLNKRGLFPRPAAVLLLLLLGVLATIDTAITQTSVLAVTDLPTGRAAFLKGEPGWYADCVNLARLTNPGDWYFGNDDCGFALSLRNPAFLPYVTNTDFTRPGDVEELVKALDHYQVKYISIEDIEGTVGPVGQDHLQPLREYIEAHYEPEDHHFLRRRRVIGHPK
jgi:hypothetical protein